MTYSKGQTIDDYHRIAAKVGDMSDVDGVITQAVGEDDGGLHVVTFWESKAQADRFESEQLFPAFAASGLPPQEMAERTTITTFVAAEVAP
jgi:hypothetical protein